MTVNSQNTFLHRNLLFGSSSHLSDPQTKHSLLFGITEWSYKNVSNCSCDSDNTINKVMLCSQLSETQNMLLDKKPSLTKRQHTVAGVITCTSPALILSSSSLYITNTTFRRPILVEFQCRMHYILLYPTMIKFEAEATILQNYLVIMKYSIDIVMLLYLHSGQCLFVHTATISFSQ